MLIFKDIFKNKTSPVSCQQEFDVFLNSMAVKEKAIFGEFLRRQIQHVVLYPAQDTIANYTNSSRKHVNFVTKSLNDYGLLIKTKQKGYNKTCLYRFNPELFKFNLRQILIKHFPFLKWIPLILLTSLQDKKMFTEVTLLRKSIFILATSTTTSKSQEELQLLLNKKLEEKVMNPYDEVKQLLKLTKVGQIKLLLFEEQAIKFALEDYKHALKIKKQIKKPFVYFFYIAKQYSIKNKLKLDWQKYYEWKEKVGFDDNTPDSEIPNKQISMKSNENKNYGNSIVNGNKHLNLSDSTDQEKELRQTQCPIMVTRSSIKPEIYYEIEDYPLDVLLKEIEETKHSIESLRSISNGKIFADIVLKGMLEKLLKLESELDRRKSYTNNLTEFNSLNIEGNHHESTTDGQSV